jgi:hypothetical protein
MKPPGGMNLVPLQSSCIRVDPGELYIFTEIVSAVFTQKAKAARNARLNSHSVA